MFILEIRIIEVRTGAFGKWFPIWRSEDGADTATYLREWSISERLAKRGAECRMRYEE